jgi:hypothetical protein
VELDFPPVDERDLYALMMHGREIGLRLEMTRDAFTTGLDPDAPFAPIGFPIDEEALYAWMEHAHEIGLNVEMSPYGFPFEAAPGVDHQLALQAILASSNHPARGGKQCGCVRISDVFVRLPDGQVKRPDLSIFCAIPAEREGYVHQVPEAVVEITSPRYVEKDLVSGPKTYLANGVKDVLALDRRTSEVHHWTIGKHTIHASPHRLELACGCEITV